MYLKKALFLSVLTDLHHTGKELHQSVVLEILGVSNLFWKSVISGLVHIISQLERFNSFFKEFVVFWFPLVSVALQVFWVCQKPLSTLLFSVAPRYSVYASFFFLSLNHMRWKPVPQAALQAFGIFYACFAVYFFTREKPQAGHFIPISVSCVSFCLQYYKFSGVSMSFWALSCSLKPPGTQGMLFLISVLRQVSQKSLL